jgi:ribose/xylose/arabinose/galactoside ABC-type transport system permease subunit
MIGLLIYHKYGPFAGLGAAILVALIFGLINGFFLRKKIRRDKNLCDVDQPL